MTNREKVKSKKYRSFFMALLTTRQAAEKLGISIPALHNRCYRGELPYIKLGKGTRRFDSEELDRIIEQGRVKAFAREGE